MQSLVTDNGQLVSELKEVLNEQLNFYSSLYCSRETVEIWDSELCEGKISEEECVEVIKTLRMENHLVTDGLPIEFYKISGTTLKILLSTPFLTDTNR